MVAELAIERAKRLVELGGDVVVLLDSITRRAAQKRLLFELSLHQDLIAVMTSTTVATTGGALAGIM